MAEKRVQGHYWVALLSINKIEWSTKFLSEAEEEEGQMAENFDFLPKV